MPLKFGVSEGFGPVSAPRYAGAIPRVIAGFVGVADRATTIVIGYIPKNAKIILRECHCEVAFDGTSAAINVGKTPVDTSGKVAAGSLVADTILTTAEITPGSTTKAVNGICLSVNETTWTAGHNAWKITALLASDDAGSTGKAHIIITYLDPDDSEWLLASTRHA
jgi:hypothetical protein